MSQNVNKQINNLPVEFR